MDQPLPSVCPPQSASLLIELEAQQEDLLRQLDELNRRIEQAIRSGQVHIHAPAATPVAA
jgi:hypothetical protein